MRETALEHQSERRRREECSRRQSRGSPASRGKDPGEAGRPGAAHGEPTQEMAAARSYGLWRGARAGAGFLSGSVAPWGTHTVAVCS